MLNRRQGLKAALAVAGLAAAPALARADVPAVVSLSERRNRFLADVEIDGRPGYRFVLDTGASTHFVSSRVAEALSLPRVEQRRVRGYDGRRIEDVVGLSQLRVGGVDLGASRAIAWSAERLEDHDGLIGYPLLFPQAVVALGQGRLSLRTPPPELQTAVAAEVMRNQTLLLGGLPGAPGRFVFDTGAQDCTLAPAFFAKAARSPAYQDAPKLIYRHEDGRTETAAFRPAAMSFGAFRIEEPVVRVGGIDGREGVFEAVDGLFGVTLIRRYTWALDQERRTLSATVGEGGGRIGMTGAGVRLRGQGGMLRVAGVQDGGPAFDAGVRPGQRVLAVAEDGGRPVLDLIDRGRRRIVELDVWELL